MSQAKSKPEASAALTRRRVFAGAGTVGALAAVAAVLPKADDTGAKSAPASAPPEPEQGGGYRVTQHVLHYYRTARV
jgi:hypothetical protein